MSLPSEVQKIDAQSKKCIAHAQKPFAYFKQTWLLTIRIKAKAKWFIAADQFPVNKFWTYLIFRFKAFCDIEFRIDFISVWEILCTMLGQFLAGFPLHCYSRCW